MSLVGPAGIGKTRLAKQLIADIADTFGEGGSWFCNLTPCKDAGEVEAAVARRMGVPQLHGEELARSLGHRGKTLLVLDNLDSLARECQPLLERWLDGAAGLQIMITSILPSRIEGEVLYELGPLLQEDAVELYRDRAHSAWADYELPEEELQAVEELVRRLDCFPLAIELAAARVRVFAPSALLTRLDQRFELLRSEGGGRHDSLLEAIKLTWELLGDVERETLAQASVFQGSFSYEAAEAICGAEAGEIALFELLDGLRRKALLQLEELNPPRYALFESVREFGRKWLRRAGRWDDLIDRHGAYFVQVGEREARSLEGPRALEASIWIEAERENLVSVLERRRAQDPALAARAGLIVAALLEIEGCPPSQIAFLEAVRGAASASQDPGLTLRALQAHAGAQVQNGRSEAGLRELDEALALAGQIGDRRQEGAIRNLRAITLARMATWGATLDEFSQAAKIGGQQGDPLLEGTAWMYRGQTEHLQQRLEDAEGSLRRSKLIFREHGLPRLEGLALNALAGVLASQERFREARQLLEVALEISRRLNNQRLEALTLANLGTASGIFGRRSGEAYLLEALEAARRMGNRRSEGRFLANLGIFALEYGELELAEERLAKGIRILHEQGERQNEATFLPFMAIVESFLGRHREATRNLEDARAVFLELGDDPNLLMLELVESLLALIAARLSPDALESTNQQVVEQSREKLAVATAPGFRRSVGMHPAIRLLRQELEHRPEDSREGAAASMASEVLRIGTEGGWFQVGSGERIDLRRRVAIRRLFDVLAERRLASPGAAMDPFDLFEIGWPGVEIDPENARRRLYFGIWTLRKLGLGEILLHQTDGYLLDPEVAVERLG